MAMAQSNQGAAADTVLRITRRLAASPEAVFRAWTEPAALMKWWGPEGCTASVQEMDARAGGRWHTCIHSAEGNDHCVGGTYREVSAPERLVFTWIWDQGDMEGVETLVTVEFRPVEGGTELTLTHDLLPSENARDLHEKDWTSSLGCLESALA